MINVHVEEPLSNPIASKRHPSHPSAATLWRWELKGVQGIYLETIKIGGRRYTSLEAIDRFAARLTELRAFDSSEPCKHRELEMARAAEQAEATFGGRVRHRP